MKKALLTILIAIMSFVACSKADLNAPANDPGMVSAKLPTEDTLMGDYFHQWDSLYHMGGLDQYAYFHAMPDPSWTTIILMGKKEADGTHFGYNGALFNKGLKSGEKLEVWVPIKTMGNISLDGKDSVSIGGWNFFQYSVGGNLTPGALLDYKDASDTSILITSPGIGTYIIQPAIMKTPRPKTLSTVVSADPAMGTVVGGGEYSKVPCQISATPKAGYDFEGWEIIGQRTGWESKMPTIHHADSASTFVVLNYNHYPFTFKAHFKPAKTVKITVQTTGTGTVSGSGYYKVNTPFTIKAIPNPGFVFAYWTLNGQRVSNSASYTLSVPDTNPRTYVAHFDDAISDYTLDIRYYLGEGLDSQASLDYIDSNGTPQNVRLHSMLNSITIKGGTIPKLNIYITNMEGNTIYCMYKDPYSVTRDLTGSDVLFSFDLPDLKGNPEIIIRAETNDFREEFQ